MDEGLGAYRAIAFVTKSEEYPFKGMSFSRSYSKESKLEPKKRMVLRQELVAMFGV